MEDTPKSKGKPDPWGVNEILRVISAKRECTSPKDGFAGLEDLETHSLAKDVYYLGDTVDDMFAARQAGVKGIGVLPPQEKSDDLRRGLMAHGAVEVLENTEDLLQMLQCSF